MSMYFESKIEAFNERSGLRPATGELREMLDRLQQDALRLIDVIALERSGIRDGDGYWHGSCVTYSLACSIFEDMKSYLDRMEALKRGAPPWRTDAAEPEAKQQAA